MSLLNRFFGRSVQTEREKQSDAVAEPVPALFLHIQKTAGTTIVDLAWKHYGYSVCSHGNFETFTKREMAEKAFVSGHFGYEYARSMMVSRYSFTFLRNPVERILSFYFFCRSRDPQEREIYHIARTLDLDQFLQAGFEHPLVKSLIWNSQVWRLACGFPNSQGYRIEDFSSPELLKMARKNIKTFSHVGFTETFERDRDIILSALQMPVPESKVVSNASKGRPAIDEVPARTMDLILALTELDRRLYDSEWSMRHT